MPPPHRPDPPPSAAPRRGVHDDEDPDAVPVGLDLARAELYRLLDALVRASHGDGHAALVREFERVWSGFRDATEEWSRARHH